MNGTLTDSCPRCGFVLDQPTAPPPPPPVLSYAAPYPAPEAPRVTAPAEGVAAGGISAASVPKILLGLGAACLLVAGAIFLAVAWSWLGIGGRTATLVGLTVATAAAGQWLLRRDLGMAAEALTTVSLGLVVMDLLGADQAGWLGTPSTESFLVVLGGTLLVASLGLCLPAARLFAPQVVAPFALGVGLGGIGGLSPGHDLLVSTIGVLAFTALALLGRRLAAVVLPWVSLAGALLVFSGLALVSLAEAAQHPELRGLWTEGHGAGLLVVAALLLLPWAVVRGNDALRQLGCACSVSVLTCAAALPVVDEGATRVTLAAAAASVVWTLLAAAAPLRWYAVPRVPLVGSLLVLAPVPLVLAAQGLHELFSVGSPFTVGPLARLDPAPADAPPLLLPLAVVVVLLAAVLTVPRSAWFRWPAVGAVAFATLLTAAHYPLPLWLFAAVLGPAGLAVALPSVTLTLLVLIETTAVAAGLVARGRGAVSEVAGLVLPAAVAATVWVAGELAGTPYDHRSVATLVVLGVLAVAVPRPELQLTSVLSVLVGTVAIAGAADPSVSLAVHLTIAGGFVTADALVHRDHRDVAWVGGALLAAATWVRLYDVGVRAPEAYTLPTAVVLLALGLERLRRDPATGTVQALLAGLSLATVPTLLWALVDPLSTRAVVVGPVLLVLLVGGAAARWTAPVLVGAAGGGALVLRELAPYAVQTPQWILIGAAGALLILVGITWEARLRDLRRAAAYVARLR